MSRAPRCQAHGPTTLRGPWAGSWDPNHPRASRRSWGPYRRTDAARVPCAVCIPCVSVILISTNWAMFPLEKKTEQCFFLVFLLKLVQAGNSGKRRFLKKRVIFNRVAAKLVISSFEFKLLFHLQIRHNSWDQRINQLRYWTDEKIQKAFHLLSHSMWILLPSCRCLRYWTDEKIQKVFHLSWMVFFGVFTLNRRQYLQLSFKFRWIS